MQKRIACITGASSGIGRTSAVALAKTGQWRIVLSGRREQELEKTAQMCRDAAGSTNGDEDLTLIVAGDVSEESNVESLFDAIKKTYGRVDMLFNNAGISLPETPIEDLPIEKFLSVMSINVTASVLCTKYATRLMKSQQPKGGRIINNGSIAAYSPRPDAAAYTISKHAISGLTKSTSLDGRKYDIACCQLDIGNAATEMGGGAANGVTQADGSKKPEPVFDVQQVGDAIVFMAGLPLGANAFNVTLTSSAMPFIARG
ncbi:short-chain dehydrogenase/reductase SDR [Filobasidium floriforme]|uniref:short-chain dehydrogenase/reductase SDR n=1 Tax=Filobasidium floriforme TaxID=5210 RepID=UPI001E8D6DBB|nr:short-chain dehydrogenase/reductase SDR [Filobasidium floriforme]KAH8080886.1 short-chain dehydrogenase/reductase SDR [Filobasidium floriforme]